MSKRHINQQREFQVNFEKICFENQTKTHLMNKLRRELTRLRSDLHFLQLNKNMAVALKEQKNQKAKNEDAEDLADDCIGIQNFSLFCLLYQIALVASIQKCILNIQNIENEFENAASSSSQQEMELMRQHLMQSPRTGRRLSNGVIILICC